MQLPDSGAPFQRIFFEPAASSQDKKWISQEVEERKPDSEVGRVTRQKTELKAAVKYFNRVILARGDWLMTSRRQVYVPAAHSTVRRSTYMY